MPDDQVLEPIRFVSESLHSGAGRDERHQKLLIASLPYLPAYASPTHILGPSQQNDAKAIKFSTLPCTNAHVGATDRILSFTDIERNENRRYLRGYQVCKH